MPLTKRHSRAQQTTSQGLSIKQFAEALCESPAGVPLGKVDRKFVVNMLAGIKQARSLNLTDIARALNESISLHATHKRLSRNLDNEGLLDNLSDRLLALGSATVSNDTRLILDVYDLNKRYARKIEYLSQPDADGPGEPEQGGFKVCEVLASDPGSGSYRPLFGHVWSDRVPGFVSDNEELRSTIYRVLKATSSRGVLYVNQKGQQSDALQNSLLSDPDVDLTAMVRMDTEVAHRAGTCTVGELVDQVDTPYGKNMFKLMTEGYLVASKTDLDIFIHVGEKAIKLPGSPRPLNLIALKSRSAFGDTTSPLITSRTNLRSRSALMGQVDAFMSATDVLKAHQTRRADFRPDNFRVLGFTRLRLLLTLLQAVIYDEAPEWASITPRTVDAAPHHGELQRTYLLPKTLA